MPPSVEPKDKVVNANGERSQARLADWFDSPLGRSLAAIEAHRLREILPRLRPSVAVQIGGFAKSDLLAGSGAGTRAVMSESGVLHPMIVGRAEALPFDAKSVDLVLLPHTLDFSVDPHGVLREAYRVLMPEGYAAILGFNPTSLWGLRRLVARGRGVPWCGHFISLLRLKDWLSLLDFEIVQGQMLYYRPPLQGERLRDRLYLLERIGDRWWPLGAGVYMVVARKRVLGLTPFGLRAPRRRRLPAGVAQPATRSY